MRLRTALATCTLILCGRAMAQSPCCSAHEGPGCSSPGCQGQVCAIDPFCCNAQWDARCASEASVVCMECQPTGACTLPFATLECPEACGSESDNPCAALAQPATPLPLDTLMHGSAWSSETRRDVDWFELHVSAPTSLQVTCWSAGPMGVTIIDDQCPPTVLAESPDGCPSVVQACVGAGTVRVAVRPLLFETIACGDPRSEYVLRATTAPCTPARPLNDRCDSAEIATLGVQAFDSGDATSEPAWLAMWCDEGAGLTFTNDVWFVFQAPATGVYRFSTCGLCDFDTRLAVYDTCGGALLACGDDSCPDGGASVELGLACATSALVRIGGWGHGAAGQLLVEAVDTEACACPADLDGTGSVDAGDLAVALLCFGDAGGPADLDMDGMVTFADVGLLLLSMGPCG